MRQAIVVFDTRFGNTKKVAEALVRGLSRTPGVRAELAPIGETRIGTIEQADLVAVGGPTEGFGESRHVKDLFAYLDAYDLHRKFGFAFDTHAPGHFHGSAAKKIEDQLRSLGAEILQPRASGMTEATGPHALGRPPALHLAEGTEAEFEALGALLGTTLLEAAQRQHEQLLSAPETVEAGGP